MLHSNILFFAMQITISFHFVILVISDQFIPEGKMQNRRLNINVIITLLIKYFIESVDSVYNILNPLEFIQKLLNSFINSLSYLIILLSLDNSLNFSIYSLILLVFKISFNLIPI